MLLCAGLPVAWLAWQIASNPGSLAGLRLDRFHLALLARTLGYNLAVALLATILALPAALVLGRGRGWIAAALWFLLPISLLIPSITYSYGWAQFLRLLHLQPALAGAADVTRCIWSLATWLWALPAAVIGLALRRLDSDLQQQALLDGALWRVTARQLVGPVVAAIACAAVLAVQEYAVYEPTGISVVATEVRQVFSTGLFSSLQNPITAPIGAPNSAGDFPTTPGQGAMAAAAVATALPLLLATALFGAVALWGVRRVSAAEDVDSDSWPAALNAGFGAKLLAIIVLLLTLFVPTAALVLRLQRPINPSLIWAESGPEVIGSIYLATLGGIAALIVALGATVRRSRPSLPLSLAGFLIGGQLLAIALIRLYNRRWLTWVYDGPPIMVMAYLARFGWLVLFAAAVTWSRPWRRIRDMASLDGAGSAQTALYVIWPLAWPLLVSAALLVLVLCLTEVPATVLISPLRPKPITAVMMQWVHTLENDPMIEASLLLLSVVLVLGCVAAALLWTGFRVARRGLGLPILRRPALGLALLALPLLGCVTLPGCADRKQPRAIWCQTGTGPRQLVYPRAITYSPLDNSFFVIDRMARIQHFDSTGGYLNEWQMPEWRTGRPVGVSVGPDGNVYIPDTHYHRVMVYSRDGKLIRQWGTKGKGPGEFIYPTDVAFDSRGRIFVSEYGENDRVQVFDASAKLLYGFGRFGSGDGEFSRPQSMLIDADSIYITDACNHRINVFKTDGAFVRNMGSTGTGLGQFRYPYGLDEDREGHLVVCEFGNNRVQLIDKQSGRGLKTWGAPGRDPGQLAYPWAVAVDKRDRIVAVDSGNNRLQVFEF